jgi:hypothetical protein
MRKELENVVALEIVRGAEVISTSLVVTAVVSVLASVIGAWV